MRRGSSDAVFRPTQLQISNSCGERDLVQIISLTLRNEFCSAHVTAVSCSLSPALVCLRASPRVFEPRLAAAL